MRERVERLAGRLAGRFFARVLTLEENRDVSLPDPDPARRYLLYLHIPFCAALCPFCSFHRVVFDRPVALDYFDGLEAEIERVSRTGFVFDEMYVGGGTPTMLPSRLTGTIALVRSLQPVTRVSVETNPDHLRPENMDALAAAGVNRLSVGVQSFDDELLHRMQRYDRYGSGEAIRERLQLASGRFDTLNVDMIFNLPRQTEASLTRDLDLLVGELGIDQASFYPLMADDAVQQSMQHTMGPVDFARERDYYEMISETMHAAGYRRESVWCFSRQSGMVDEYIADREEYVGLGSGAFSYVGGALVANTFSIPRYTELTTAGSAAAARMRHLSEREQMRYYLLMQLFGGTLDLPAAEDRFGGRFRKSLRAELTVLSAIGATAASGDRITLTDDGRYLWVVLMREFFAGINLLREQLQQDATAPPAGEFTSLTATHASENTD